MNTILDKAFIIDKSIKYYQNNLTSIDIEELLLMYSVITKNKDTEVSKKLISILITNSLNNINIQNYLLSLISHIIVFYQIEFKITILSKNNNILKIF